VADGAEIGGPAWLSPVPCAYDDHEIGTRGSRCLPAAVEPALWPSLANEAEAALPLERGGDQRGDVPPAVQHGGTAAAPASSRTISDSRGEALGESKPAGRGLRGARKLTGGAGNHICRLLSYLIGQPFGRGALQAAP